jgi:hypothetical protein
MLLGSSNNIKSQRQLDAWLLIFGMVAVTGLLFFISKNPSMDAYDLSKLSEGQVIVLERLRSRMSAEMSSFYLFDGYAYIPVKTIPDAANQFTPLSLDEGLPLEPKWLGCYLFKEIYIGQDRSDLNMLTCPVSDLIISPASRGYYGETRVLGAIGVAVSPSYAYSTKDVEAINLAGILIREIAKKENLPN